MSMLVSLLIVLGLQLVISVMIPPKITKQSPKDIFYKPKETVKMECEASGIPQPSFTWRRAEVAFSPEGNDDRIVQQYGAGTLIINSPEDKDEGIYQCFASNSQGTAATIKFNLKMAKLDEFITSTQIIHEPQLGTPLTMNCQSPDSVPDAQIYWAFGDNSDLQPVYWDNRITMDYEDRLYFTYVTAEDHQNGKPYHCVAYNSIMRMSVIGPPHYINPKGTTLITSSMAKLWPTSRFDEKGLVGSNFKMKCIFSGNPAPFVIWKRKDSLPFSDRVQLGNSGGQELVIENLQFEDAGTYLCDSYRDQESTLLEMSVNLNVNSRPVWKSKPKDVIVGENGTAVFDCLVEGVPKPQIFWFVNGEPLSAALRNDKRLDYRFQHVKEDKIVLQRVTKEDTMVFQCNATNLHGYLWAEAFLNVLSEAPSILTEPKHLKVAEGEPFKMACEVAGKPDPIITWYKNGQHVTGGRYFINETGNLHVDVSVLSDAGEFRCEAHNVYGRVEALANLIVRRKTVIQWAPMDIEVQRGINAKFTCSGTTDPEETTQLSTTWLKDGEPVDLGTRMFSNLQDHSLTISGGEQRDTGTYTCVVSNGLDSDSASARLVVTDIPDPPYDLKINDECMKNNTAQLIWIAGSFNNAPIEYFVIEYVTTMDPKRWVFAARVDYRADTAFIPLSSGMDFSFRIISYNKIGASSPSLATTTVCMSNVSTPIQNPRNVRTIGDKRGMLHIVWTPVPPEQQGGSNFAYIINIQRVGDPDNSVFTTKIQDWRIYEYLYDASGVDYTAYKISVRSSNVAGDSKEEVPIIYGHSSEGAPNVSPTNLNVLDIHSDSALFTWQFDRSQIGKISSTIRGEFRGFKIQFWEQSRQAETIRDYDVTPEMVLSNATSNTFSATVPNLIPNTRLQARVSVLNNFFVSAPSDVIAFVTPPGLPGPVEIFQDINIGDNHVNLVWRSPLDSKGDVIGYDIGYQEVRGLHVDEMQERNPQIDDQFTTSAMLSGLMPNTNYRIHIWARTIGGRGEGYYIERTTDYPGVPMVPRFTISGVGTDYINITWWRDAYKRSGTVVYVEYKKEDGAEWFSTTPDVSKDWVKLGFLQAGIRYNVRLAITNGETRRLSQIEDVTTDGSAKAYDVVANLGWFLGMVFSILLEIVLVTVFVICYRRGFRFKGEDKEIRTYRDGSDTYTDEREIAKASDDFGPEPGGFINDIYRDGYDDGYEDDNDGNDGYEEGDNRYSNAITTHAEVSRSHPTYKTSDDYDNDAPNGDYESYSQDGRADTSYNKSDFSDTDSYLPPSSSRGSDSRTRGPQRDEYPRDRTGREVRSRDYNESQSADSTGRKQNRRQTDQRKKKSSDLAVHRKRDEDSRRRDDRQSRRPRQDYSQKDDHGGQHNDDYDDRRKDGYDDRREDGYDDRREDGYGDRREGDYDDRREGGYDDRREGGYGDNRIGAFYDGHNDDYNDRNNAYLDDRYKDDYRRHSQGHDDQDHDHEKCDDVVDELKRYSTGPGQESPRGSYQGYADTIV